jgi:hypothetical protein
MPNDDVTGLGTPAAKFIGALCQRVGWGGPRANAPRPAKPAHEAHTHPKRNPCRWVRATSLDARVAGYVSRRTVQSADRPYGTRRVCREVERLLTDRARRDPPGGSNPTVPKIGPDNPRRRCA